MSNDAAAHLTSLQNPCVKGVIRLRDRRERDDTGMFIIEGYRELLRAVDAGHAIDTLYICPQLFLGTNEHALISRITARGTPLYECSEPVFRKISYRDRPDGLVAAAKKKHLSIDDLEKMIPKGKPPFLVIAEAIEKPGNLGTILRSSDAVHVDGLIVCDQCTDIHNPNVVRASVGTLFTVPVCEASSKDSLSWLKQRGIKVVAATPAAKEEFTAVDLSGPIAIAVGTEQLGLSDLWMQEADIQVRIPMCGVADSLNVAMATTLLLYEVHRQRHEKASGKSRS